MYGKKKWFLLPPAADYGLQVPWQSQWYRSWRPPPQFSTLPHRPSCGSNAAPTAAVLHHAALAGGGLPFAAEVRGGSSSSSVCIRTRPVESSHWTSSSTNEREIYKSRVPALSALCSLLSALCSLLSALCSLLSAHTPLPNIHTHTHNTHTHTYTHTRARAHPPPSWLPGTTAVAAAAGPSSARSARARCCSCPRAGITAW